MLLRRRGADRGPSTLHGALHGVRPRRHHARVAPAAVVTPEQVRGLRAARQHLAVRAPREALLDVVRDVCGLHAQVLSSAVLQAHVRVDGLRPGEVQRLLWEDRVLVKTWAMRGTLHLLAAAELGLWCSAQRALPPRWASGAWLRAAGMTAEQAEAFYAAVPRVLDGPPLTREALAAAIGEALGDEAAVAAAMGSWGSMIKPAAMRGDMVFADDEERRVRFTRPDRWLGAPPDEHDPAEAIAEVTRRFLARYGPATREDLARWFGTSSAATAGRWIKALGDEVAEVEVLGGRRWCLAADVDALAAAEPPPPAAARLLPAFDHHVVALLKDPVALDQERRAAVSRQAGWITPVVLVGGAMAGVWRHDVKGRVCEVAVEPFGRLPKAARTALTGEAERLAAFLGAELRLTFAA